MSAREKLSQLLFYSSPRHPCSYLPDRDSAVLFADPEVEIDTETYTILARIGFRRSGPHIYRPHCGTCTECIPVRIPVSRFQPSRNQKRVLSKNRDIQSNWVPAEITDEYYELFERYISERHKDGDMYPPSREQYESMFVDARSEAHFLTFRLEERLLAVAAVDLMLDGLSAIYTFFDPDFSDRSPGTLAVLRQTDIARQLGLPYVYLGYWVKNCAKMAYKSVYQPLEIFQNDEWRLMDSDS